MESNRARSGGIGLMGALFLVFLVLKLTDQIAWSWWWVTAPLWGPAVLAGLVIGALAGAVIWAEKRRSERP